MRRKRLSLVRILAHAAISPMGLALFLMITEGAQVQTALYAVTRGSQLEAAPSEGHNP